MNQLLHWNLEDIADWPRAHQSLAILLFGLICFGVAAKFYLEPKLNQLNAAKQQENVLSRQFSALNKQAEQRRMLETKLAVSETKAELLASKLKSPYQHAEVVDAINRHSNEYGLTFEQIRWGKAQADNGYVRQGITIELQGDYHAIGKFIAALATLDYLIVFEHSTWQRVSANASRLKWRAQAYLYQAMQEQP